MSDINKQIEEMAEKMEKSSADPKETLFSLIKSLGPAGLKEKLPTLSDEEKVVLKAALEEMNIQKAVSFDKEAQAVKHVQGKFTDTIIQEDKADDDADEKLVKPEAAKMDHQGTPTEGWEGQVIKSIEESEDQLDILIEKAMDKCNDSKMVAEKLEKKGMNKDKVQGALEKYKAKKDMKKSEDLEKGKMKEAREDAKEKIMEMEEKEHGTKDPKKLVQAEKKEHKEEKKEMKKAVQTEIEPDETKQSGDVAEMNKKPMGKKTSAPDIEDNAKANKKNMTKSISWEDETRLLKANTQGRNFNFNVEQFIEETLKNEPQEQVQKSEDGKEDLNDLIAKGKDKSWDQEMDSKKKEEAKKKMNGKMVKSFADAELAEVLGISEEEAKKILGE